MDRLNDCEAAEKVALSVDVATTEGETLNEAGFVEKPAVSNISGKPSGRHGTWGLCPFCVKHFLSQMDV